MASLCPYCTIYHGFSDIRCLCTEIWPSPAFIQLHTQHYLIACRRRINHPQDTLLAQLSKYSIWINVKRKFVQARTEGNQKLVDTNFRFFLVLDSIPIDYYILTWMTYLNENRLFWLKFPPMTWFSHRQKFVFNLNWRPFRISWQYIRTRWGAIPRSRLGNISDFCNRKDVVGDLQ